MVGGRRGEDIRECHWGRGGIKEKVEKVLEENKEEEVKGSNKMIARWKVI
jgi:hypothetical protein